MRYLGIDYGKKRIGLAFGERGLARPLGSLPNNPDVVRKIGQICQKEAIDQLVLGWSEDLREEIEVLKGNLESELGLPCEFEDETLTTRAGIATMLETGSRRKKRREEADAAAAAEILASFLVKKGGENV
ncbi:pre-16S rRNA-processing nuclease YqgF [Candidatus Shapirobacteria bacterium]|nr:pre-16S rRNA-processing nuclease YqgF [Candidatus Shapirobacteria bacterium]